MAASGSAGPKAATSRDRWPSGNAVTVGSLVCLRSLVSPRASTIASPLGDEWWARSFGEGAQMLTDILDPALAF
jgi:hypothetical protein